jgi:hypothetical protein
MNFIDTSMIGNYVQPSQFHISICIFISDLIMLKLIFTFALSFHSLLNFQKINFFPLIKLHISNHLNVKLQLLQYI